MKLRCYARSGCYDLLHPNDVSTSVIVKIVDSDMKADLTVASSDVAEEWQERIERNVLTALREAIDECNSRFILNNNIKKAEEILAFIQNNKQELLIPWYEYLIDEYQEKVADLESEIHNYEDVIDDLENDPYED